MLEKVIPGKAKILFGDNGILTLVIEHKATILEGDAKDITNTISELVGDKIHCNLVDISQMTFMDNRARAVFARQNKKTVPAIAIINNSTFNKSLLNLYFKFSQPKIPTKVFTEEEPAKEWLYSMLQ